MKKLSRLPALSNVFYMLSGIVAIVGLAMVPSLVLSLFEDGSMAIVFGGLVVCLGLVAIILRLGNYRPSELTIRDGFFITALSWISLAVLGSIPFVLGGFIPSWTDAFFESMSGFTTTGASILKDIEKLPDSLLLWRSMTHWLGGMGVIALAVAIFPLMGASGYQLFRAEVPGPTTEKLTPRIRTTAGYLWLVYSGLTLLQIILLLTGGMPLLDSVITAFGTMATGGFSNKNASIAAYDSAYLQYVIIVFMFLAGASFTLHFKALSGRPLSYLRDPEFRFYGLVILGTTMFILLDRFLVQGTPVDEAGVRGTLFSVVSIITTTGFITENYELWPMASQLVLILLMLIGGSTGSTSGGIKCIRIQISLKYIITELRKLAHQSSIHLVRLGRTAVPESAIPNVIAFVLLFLGLFACGVIIMTALGLKLDAAIGSVAATLGNVGPGLGSVGPVANFADVSEPGKWVLSFLMLLGRLELWTVLLLFTRRFWVS